MNTKQNGKVLIIQQCVKFLKNIILHILKLIFLFTKELESILKKLKSLKKEFFEIEEQQKKDGLLSNSDMDKLIYANYDDFVGSMHYMYGKLSDSEVRNRRKLITDSIKYYKNLQNEK